MLRSEATNVIREVQNESTSVGLTYTFVYMKTTQTTKLSDLKLEIRLKLEIKLNHDTKYAYEQCFRSSFLIDIDLFQEMLVF